MMKIFLRLILMLSLGPAATQADDDASCPASPAARQAYHRPVLTAGEIPWSMKPLAARSPALVVELPPVQSAARHQLLRRLTFVASGLPPRDDDASAFLTDSSPRALDKVVDRLIADATAPQRLAEVWLRATGYTDRWPEAAASASLQAPEAWRYRDWVVKTLRTTPDPRPLARLTLAGDTAPETPPGTPNLAGLTATLWHVTAAPPAEEYEETVVRWATQQAVRSSQAFLALDLTCARCHDHPAVPLSSEEAAGIVAIFAHSHALVPGPDGRPALNRVPTGSAAAREKRTREVALLQSEEARRDAMRQEFALMAAVEFLPQTAEYVRLAWAWHRQPQGTLAAFADARGLLETPLEQWLTALGLTSDPPPHSLHAPWWNTWTAARQQGTPDAIAAAAEQIQTSHRLDENSPFFHFSAPMEKLFSSDQRSQLKKQSDKINSLQRRIKNESHVAAMAEGPPPGMDAPSLSPRLPSLLTGENPPSDITPATAGRRALAAWLENEGATFFARLAALRLSEGLGHPLLPEPSSLSLWTATRPPEAAAIDAIAAQLLKGGWPAAAKYILRMQAATPVRKPLRLGGSEWRDAILFVSGTLDPRQDGSPDAAPDSTRRSLYREWAPFPSPPTGAFLETQARALAQLARKKVGTDPLVQLTFITHRLFHRRPDTAERAQLSTSASVADVCTTLLQSEEFRTLP